MTTDSNRIKERIRNLLNVTSDNGATDGEIDNAIRFARSLMAKHHLSEEDLVVEPEQQYEDIESADKDRKYVYLGKRRYYWEGRLASFVCGLVGCKYYFDNCYAHRRTPHGTVELDKRGEPTLVRRFCFYGLAEDTAIAKSIYDELRTVIIAAALLRHGGAFKGDGGMYCEGFVAGLAESNARVAKQERIEAEQSSSSTALVLIERRNDLINRKQELASTWLEEECGVKLRSGSGLSGASGSMSAFRQGKADGRKQSVSAARRPKLN